MEVSFSGKNAKLGFEEEGGGGKKRDEDVCPTFLPRSELTHPSR